ncbi:ComF family protein [Patescibacteria group bacterium]
MEGFVSRLAVKGSEALFPRFCARCSKEGSVWCQSCDESYLLHQAKASCPFCGQGHLNQTCLKCSEQTYLDGVFSLTYYANPMIREVLTAWKYHSDQQITELVKKLIYRYGSRIDWLDSPFEVSYVPLHISRLRARSFDQAEVIAEAVAALFVKKSKRLLKRSQKTSPQAKKDHQVRLIGDMDGIFEVIQPGVERVILCDDVFTSGATMDAAAKVLKETGTKTVWGFTIAQG